MPEILIRFTTFEILFIFNWLTYSKFPEGRCLQQDKKFDLKKNCKELEIFCFVLVWESTCSRSGNVNSLFFSSSLFPLFLYFRMYVFGGWVPQSAGGEISAHDGEWKCTGSFCYLNLGQCFSLLEWAFWINPFLME